MLQPFKRLLFMSYRNINVQYLCVVVSLDTCNSDKILLRGAGLVNISHRNSASQRDLWVCAIIKLQLSTAENPIPFSLIPLMNWYISRAVLVLTVKPSKNQALIFLTMIAWLGFFHVLQYYIKHFIMLMMQTELDIQRMQSLFTRDEL